MVCTCFFITQLKWPILEQPLWLFRHVIPANAALLSCYCCSVSGLWVWTCYYRNHTEGQCRGEEGETVTYEGREEAVTLLFSDWLEASFNPAHHCVMTIIISAAKLVTGAAAYWISLCISVYWVIVRDAVYMCTFVAISERGMLKKRGWT